MRWFPYVILPLLAVGAVTSYYLMTAGALRGNPYGKPSENNTVVLYSLEHCGKSALYRKQIGSELPTFQEVDATRQEKVLAELEARLLATGYDMDGMPMIYHLPVVEVNGELLPRAGIGEIRRALRYY